MVVRGATSAFGRAVVNLAVNASVKVIATTRSMDRSQIVLDIGVHRVELEGPNHSKRLPELKSVDAVLDLVGNSVTLDSLSIPRRGRRVCIAGWLCGLSPFSDFNPLLQMPSGVHISFFGSFHFGTPRFPLADVSLQGNAKDVATGGFNAKSSRVFQFEEISQAHELMESNQASGKLVVKLGGT